MKLHTRFCVKSIRVGGNDDSNDRKGELFAFENKAPVRSLVR